MKLKDDAVKNVENEKMLLEEKIESAGESKNVKPGKTFSPVMRLMVYDAIVNQVPTRNIPVIISKFALRFDVPIDCVPHRSTVEMMTRELGVIADLQTAEAILQHPHVTLGFDATTQEGVHVNSIHVTTTSNCYVIAVDELPGGTAVDYSQHICGSIDHLATLYSTFTHTDFQKCRTDLIGNITNCMMDRVAANHAAILLVNEEWGKTLTELNCHLHPLDTVASSARSALKQLETSKGKLFGNDCVAGNIVLQMNKLRFKDGKGDPRGFKAFLESEHLPRGFIPRYRGNRLHILFSICGKYHEKYDAILCFLQSGTVACGGLTAAIANDFASVTAKCELHVLGLFGKLFSGPWMQKFYTSAESGISHVEGIGVVKAAIAALKEQLKEPRTVLSATHDLLGGTLDVEGDTALQKLLQQPADLESFCDMMTAVMSVTVTVLERQYKKYFEINLTAKLAEETKSARSHNIDAEEIMGMFSSLKTKSPNATICFLSAKMRAVKNRTVNDYLDTMDAVKQKSIVGFAITNGRKERAMKIQKQSVIRMEMSKRIAAKKQKKQTQERKQMERWLKTAELSEINERFNIETTKQVDLADILQGKIIGRRICHAWSDDGVQTVYNGKVTKLRAKSQSYIVAYWSQGEAFADAVDYNMTMHELAADLLHNDLELC